MNVNGVGNSNYTSAYAAQIKGANQTEDANSKDNKKANEAANGVVYEKSNADKKVDKKANQATIAQLKADADARTAQLRDLVEKLMMQQGQKFNEATMWNDIRLGNFKVDAETAAQAAKDISEDGYWGVKQTSQRIVDFAKALTGGDKSKIEEMRKAFEKGYKAAGVDWGGDLPSISKQTYDAVMKGFDDWANEE